jgi:diphthamide biosynthesis protein 2
VLAVEDLYVAHSCCVDEVAAEHVNADLVVHYGHACMSPSVESLAFAPYARLTP